MLGGDGTAAGAGTGAAPATPQDDIDPETWEKVQQVQALLMQAQVAQGKQKKELMERLKVRACCPGACPPASVPPQRAMCDTGARSGPFGRADEILLRHVDMHGAGMHQKGRDLRGGPSSG